MDKIISVIFKVESEGYQAMTELKQNPADDTYTVPEAVLIKKEGGSIVTLDSFDTGIETTDDLLKGELIGSLIGILGGPMGMLLGGSIGALTGSAIDLGDALQNESLIERVSEQIMDGEVVLIALAEEEKAGTVANMFAKFDASVVENDVAEVEEEIRLADQTQRELEAEARAKLRESKKAEIKQNLADTKAKIEAGIESAKDKLTNK